MATLLKEIIPKGREFADIFISTGRESMFKIVQHDEGINLLVELALKNNLILILGSGFTAGCKAHQGNVLNGPQLTDEMKKHIVLNSKTYKKEDIKSLDFNETADIFLDKNEVPIKVRHSVFKKYFTNVQLEDHKIKFINTYWNYIYSLNLDDAIQNDTDFFKILTYLSLNTNFYENIEDKKVLFKIHGDVNHELISDSNENIVFSEEQYISSITNAKNATLKNYIYSDYKQKNILFVGCGLVNEPDIRHIFNDVRNDIGSSYRIQLRSKTPSKAEERNLNKYGINTILLVKDYDLFYKDFYNTYEREQSKYTAKQFAHINPKISIENDKISIIKYTSGLSIYNGVLNTFSKPANEIDRTVIREILPSIEDPKSVCTIIRGRRFSGKTYLLSLLCEKLSKYTVFFFSSTSLFNSKTIMTLIKANNNSIFIFDSNSISPIVRFFLSSSDGLLRKNNNRLLIATNTNEDALIDRLDAKIYEVSYLFDKKELQDFNRKSNRLAFIQRTIRNTNLDYAYELVEQNKRIAKFPLNISTSSLTDEEKSILILLGANEKIFFHELVAINIDISIATDFVNRNSVLFEIIDSDPEESNGRSIKKIVHNSKVVLMKMLLTMNDDDVIKTIKGIVKSLYLDDTLQYKNIILFDTLNQLFRKDGAGKLINKLYAELEDILFDDLHFWLQRAKSIYRLFKDDKDKLYEAETYSNKVFKDSLPHKNIKIKAALTTSLICSLLYNLETDEQKKYELQIEAINLANFAIMSKHFRFIPNSVQNDFYNKISRKQSVDELLVEICTDFLDKNKIDRDTDVIKIRAVETINKLKLLKNEYLRKNPKNRSLEMLEG